VNESLQSRREGYAPDNFAIGRKGMGTRQKIIRRANDLFVVHGYHGTSIEAIAKAAGGSRATVYQYFEDKEDIRLALMQECDTDLLSHAKRLQRLGPDLEGLEVLTGWLHELADLYDRHTAVLLEFPGIGFDQGLPAAHAADVSARYLTTVADRLSTAEIHGVASPESAALALLRISHMVNVYRSRNMFGLGSAAAVSRSLAVAMQLMLFPTTPIGAAEPAADREPVRCDSLSQNPSTTAGASAVDVSPIRQDVLTAASTLFAQRGYHNVSMDDIAASAATSRATVYRHFNAKLAILAELTDWSLVEGRDLAYELQAMGSAGAQRDPLHEWLSRYARFHRNYGGVIRAWYDGDSARALPGDPVGRGQKPFHDAARSVVSHIRLPHGLTADVAAAVFLAVLGRLSETAISRHPEVSDYGIATFMVAVLERALFSRTWTEPTSA
jgi:AcrR family transcriptional regulator